MMGTARTVGAALLALGVIFQPHVLASSLRTDFLEPDFAKRFGEAVSQGRYMKRYNAGALQKAIDRFNRAQDNKFHVSDDYRLPPAGHHAVALKDMGDLFVLQFMVTTKGHTDGIDGGEDAYRSLVFDKKTLRQLGDFDGELLGDAPGTLRVVIPAKETCAGHRSGETYSVVDVSRDKTYFSDSLPQNPRDVAVSAADGNPPNIQRFTIGLTSIGDSTEQGKDDQCEASYWVRFTDISIDLACDLRKGTCKQQKTEGRSYEGCMPIGACD